MTKEFWPSPGLSVTCVERTNNAKGLVFDGSTDHFNLDLETCATPHNAQRAIIGHTIGFIKRTNQLASVVINKFSMLRARTRTATNNPHALNFISSSHGHPNKPSNQLNYMQGILPQCLETLLWISCSHIIINNTAGNHCVLPCKFGLLSCNPRSWAQALKTKLFFSLLCSTNKQFRNEWV